MASRKMSRCAVLLAASLAVLCLAPSSGGMPGGLSAPAAAAERQSREDYIKQNEGRFEQWGRKIDGFNEKAQRKGAAAKKTVDRKLDAAWSDVKQHWAEAKSASAEKWDDAKKALEESWRQLERVWADAQS